VRKPEELVEFSVRLAAALKSAVRSSSAFSDVNPSDGGRATGDEDHGCQVNRPGQTDQSVGRQHMPPVVETRAEIGGAD